MPLVCLLGNVKTCLLSVLLVVCHEDLSPVCPLGHLLWRYLFSLSSRFVCKDVPPVLSSRWCCENMLSVCCVVHMSLRYASHLFPGPRVIEICLQSALQVMCQWDMPSVHPFGHVSWRYASDLFCRSCNEDVPSMCLQGSVYIYLEVWLQFATRQSVMETAHIFLFM